MGFRHLLRLVVENHEVAILEVEAVEFVAGRFSVHDVFKDDEGSAFCIAGYALADLSAEEGVLASVVVRAVSRDSSETGVDLPDSAKAAKEVEQLLRRNSKGQVLAKQRSIHFGRELHLD